MLSFFPASHGRSLVHQYCTLILFLYQYLKLYISLLLFPLPFPLPLPSLLLHRFSAASQFLNLICAVNNAQLGFPSPAYFRVSRQNCKATVEIISFPFALEITAQHSLLSNVVIQQLLHVFRLVVYSRRETQSQLFY